MKELIYHRHLLPAVERHADKVGFIDGAYRGTYAKHIDRVARLCAALRELGVGRQDRFAIMALNSHQFLECYHAAFLGAGVMNPLNLRLAPKELEYILHDSGTKTCFVDAMFAPVIAKIRAAAGIEQVVLIGDGDVPAVPRALGRRQLWNVRVDGGEPSRRAFAGDVRVWILESRHRRLREHVAPRGLQALDRVRAPVLA